MRHPGKIPWSGAGSMAYCRDGLGTGHPGGVAELRARVFEQFFRVEHHHGIVEAHGIALALKMYPHGADLPE